METRAETFKHSDDTDPAVRVLLEAVPDQASIIAADGTFLAVNSALAAMAALNGIGDFRRHKFFEFIAPEDAAVAEQLRGLLHDGKAGRFECATVDREARRRRRFEFRVVPLPYRPGGGRGIHRR